MTMQAWIAFAVLVTFLSFTPGPAVLLILSQALSHGFGRTAWAILGIVAANTLFFFLSGVGLAAILIASPNLLSAIKWFGAGYLVLIGAIEMYSKGSNSPSKTANATRASTGMFFKGFVLQVSNPTALLFFVAVIPQFLNVKAPIASQVILLAVAGNVAELLVLSFYAGIADSITAIVTQESFRSYLQRLSGFLLIAVGIGLAIFNR